MKNNKGFTLIELLAVIVILGVLLAIAIPSVSKYINTAKKSSFVINVKEYVDAAKKEVNLIDTEYELPINYGDAITISFKELRKSLENGGKKSPYGSDWRDDSEVVILNDGSAEKPHYTYYVVAYDEKGYSIGTKIGNDSLPCPIAYDNISNDNVVMVDFNKLNNIDPSVCNSGIVDQEGNQISVNIVMSYGFEHVVDCPTCK